MAVDVQYLPGEFSPRSAGPDPSLATADQAALPRRATLGAAPHPRHLLPPLGARVRPLPGLLPYPLGLRAGGLSARVGERPGDGDVHPRLLRRAHDHEAEPGHAQEPEAAPAA